MGLQGVWGHMGPAFLQALGGKGLDFKAQDLRKQMSFGSELGV